MDTHKKITVTVVIPVYNASQYIGKCIESVIAQSYPYIELLLINDCSTDNSLEVIEKYISNTQVKISIIIINHDKNSGASAARNTGIKCATGNYIFFLDSDDWIIPSCIESMINIIKKYPQLDMVQGGITTTNNSIPWYDFEKNPYPEYTNDFYTIKTQLLGREILPTSAWNKLIPINFLRENNIFFHEGIVIEDVLWCNTLAKHVKSIACINKNTYIYRIHENSIVTSGLGVDPKRKLIVYDLMIDNIDEPYVKEQVAHLTNQLEKIYFENDSSEIRKIIGKLYKKLLPHCNRKDKVVLILKAFCTQYDKGNKSIAYYIYYLISTQLSLYQMIKILLNKIHSYIK